MKNIVILVSLILVIQTVKAQHPKYTDCFQKGKMNYKSGNYYNAIKDFSIAIDFAGTSQQLKDSCTIWIERCANSLNQQLVDCKRQKYIADSLQSIENKRVVDFYLHNMDSLFSIAKYKDVLKYIILLEKIKESKDKESIINYKVDLCTDIIKKQKELNNAILLNYKISAATMYKEMRNLNPHEAFLKTSYKYVIDLMDKDNLKFNCAKPIEELDFNKYGNFSFGEFDFLDMKYVVTDLDSSQINMWLGIDFYFSPEAISFMGKMIMQSTDSVVDVSNTNFRNGLLGFINSTEEVDSIISKINMVGKCIPFPEEMNFNILFSDLKLIWDKESDSYKSVGSIGISNIGTKQINKYVNGYVNVMRNRFDDMIDIYLQADESTWFFFTYSRGIMSTLSSLTTYNDIIFDVKEKDRTLENKETGKTYYYEKSSLPTRAASKRRFEEGEE